MHYAEGSLMNWVVMQLVFDTIPRQPMPFFVRPIARALCGKVQQKLIHPNVQTALTFMEAHLAHHSWFAGEHLSMADFQMSFAIEAVLTRGGNEAAWPTCWPTASACRRGRPISARWTRAGPC
jgi:glutathione S-transferase